MQDQLHHPSTDGPPTIDDDAVLAALGRVLKDADAAEAAQTMASPAWQATFARIRASVPAAAITDEHTPRNPAQPGSGNQ
ncbi:hypothetical protein ACFVVL_27760 [Kitasatospora sp. NPDC058115]|uniref:hypothetical protein n=1 Tax=Kitasatospora sp. NPDC058115 TaxID=3346347 RepID=UPI0036DCA151